MAKVEKIAAIIVTYNAMKWAEKCFNSLRNSSVPLSVYVVDNGSTDGTQDYLKQNFPEIECIESDENLGFGQANNVGIEKAYQQGATHFFLLNQDTWIFPSTVENLRKALHSTTEKYGIISPVHLDGSERKLDYGFQNYLQRNTLPSTFLSDVLIANEQEKTVYPLDFVNAAAWFMPKSTLEKVGGFSPLFFHYGEDRNFIDRLHCKGLQLGFVPQCYIVHDRIRKSFDSKMIHFPYTKVVYAFTSNPEYTTVKAYQWQLFKDMMRQFLLGHWKQALKIVRNMQYIQSQKENLNQLKKEEKESSAFLHLKNDT